jgi:hypothetical protein
VTPDLLFWHHQKQPTAPKNANNDDFLAYIYCKLFKNSRKVDFKTIHITMFPQRLLISLMLVSTTVVDAFTVGTKQGGMQSRLLLLRAVSNDDNNTIEPPKSSKALHQQLSLAFATLGCGLAFQFAAPVWADGQTDTFKFPPIDFADKDRCVLRSSSMGQANAARDKLYDLRQCKLSGVAASGYDLSGVSK